MLHFASRDVLAGGGGGKKNERSGDDDKKKAEAAKEKKKGTSPPLGLIPGLNYFRLKEEGGMDKEKVKKVLKRKLKDQEKVLTKCPGLLSLEISSQEPKTDMSKEEESKVLLSLREHLKEAWDKITGGTGKLTEEHKKFFRDLQKRAPPLPGKEIRDHQQKRQKEKKQKV